MSESKMVWWCPLHYMVWCRLVWCGINYVIWCGADWYCGVRYVIYSSVDWSGRVGYGLWFGTTWSGAKLLWFSLVWSGMVKTFWHMVTVVVKLKTIPLALTLNKVTLGVLNIILVQEYLKINAYIYRVRNRLMHQTRYLSCGTGSSKGC